MILCPARLEPVFSPRLWGSRSLAPFFPEKSNLAEPIGEAWMTGSECRFANGPFAGKKLGEAWPEMSPEWTGTRADRTAAFPLLVKFIFTEEKLSVQVHPDDDYAARHEQAAGGRGKTEMWYALRARPGAEVLVGLKPSVTREDFKRAIAGGSAEGCLDGVPLGAGEAVFVPAGTAHTIGPGLVLCEIQEHSDLTYRVYDYNRRDAHGKTRPLHIEKALDVIRFGKQHGGKIEPVRIHESAAEKTYFASCRYFETARWEFSEPVPAATSQGSFDLLIFLEGAGTIHWNREHAAYGPAQVWMIPAGLGAYTIVPGPPTSFLRTYVPREPGEFGPALSSKGVKEADWSRLVHR
ncbi:MAG TPA: type I phosphomannose isomerase catalytic subunit [Candidatus Acidoferrales bacterium]|jgi:mannose-6-phosphate isomerase|nr:type I phosphomannose isomerase catalytic subunit [Candidatus Acidoferrales bacterium]